MDGGSKFRRILRRGVSLWLLLAILVVECPLLAQEAVGTDPVAAELLFQKGLELLRVGRWSEACPEFEKSIALDPSGSTSIKLARCREHEGKVASAWYEYQVALKLVRDKPAPEPRQSRLLEVIERESGTLLARLPRLRVRVQEQPPGLMLSRDGQPLALEVLGEALPVDPGEHEVQASAPGFQAVTRRVHAIEGDTTDVELVLSANDARAGETVTAGPTRAPDAARGAAEQRPPPPLAPEPMPEDDPWNRKHTAFVLGSVGLAALAGAGYMTYRVLAEVEESNKFCDGSVCQKRGDEYRDDARRDQAIGIACGAVGVAALGVAVVLYTAAPKDGNGQRARQTTVRLMLDHRGIAAAAHW